MKSENKKQEEYKKVSCPFCSSANVIKRGFRQTENRGKIQRYSCQDCNKRFVEDKGFFRMRNSEKKITLCLDLFFKGVSTRQVQQHLQQFYPHNSTWVSIYNWVVKYSKQISQFTDKIKIQASKEIQIDEMEIGSRKSQYRGYFIDCIDTQTRFMVSSEFTKDRDIKQIQGVLSNAKHKTENQVEIITSDSWRAYPKAIHKTFTLKNKSNTKKFGVVHNQICASKGDGFNYKIERLHNSVRQRIKVCRGFHGSTASANTLMKGYEVFYNFIRTHQAIKCTPSELATDIKLTGNKWLDLIQISNQNNLK